MAKKRKAALKLVEIRKVSEQEKAESFFKTMPVGIARKMLQGSSLFILHLMRELGYPEERMESSTQNPIDLNALLDDIRARLTRGKNIEIEFNRLAAKLEALEK